MRTFITLYKKHLNLRQGLMRVGWGSRVFWERPKRKRKNPQKSFFTPYDIHSWTCAFSCYVYANKQHNQRSHSQMPHDKKITRSLILLRVFNNEAISERETIKRRQYNKSREDFSLHHVSIINSIYIFSLN